jgi:nitroreductase
MGTCTCTRRNYYSSHHRSNHHYILSCILIFLNVKGISSFLQLQLPSPSLVGSSTHTRTGIISNSNSRTFHFHHCRHNLHDTYFSSIGKRGNGCSCSGTELYNTDTDKETLFPCNQYDFDSIVEARYACTRFQRQGEISSIATEANTDTTSSSLNPTATISNSTVVKLATECLNLSRRAPSGFNAQPYRLLMVNTKSKKEQVAKFCIGRNADRVRDSDCTVLFLADKECLREYKRFSNFLDDKEEGGTVGTENSNGGTGMKKSKKRTYSKWSKRKMQAFILLFSSGWPLPRILSNPISFVTRLSVSAVSAITRRKVLVPSLGSAETWASKNTMLVAMTYMLACSSRGLATSPMEGFNAGGLRKVLGIPKRYAIPLIVSTGLPYQREFEEEGFDDVGMEHGPKLSRRYPKEEVVFVNEFGVDIEDQTD